MVGLKYYQPFNNVA